MTLACARVAVATLVLVGRVAGLARQAELGRSVHVPHRGTRCARIRAFSTARSAEVVALDARPRGSVRVRGASGDARTVRQYEVVPA